MPGDFFGPHSVLDFDWAWLKSHDGALLDGAGRGRLADAPVFVCVCVCVCVCHR